MYEVDQYTISLLHFEDGLKDECGNTWTATGNVVVSADQKVDGNSSLFAPEGAYIKSTNNKYVFGSGDFTVDFWMYYQSGYSGVSSAQNSNIGIVIQSDIIEFGQANSYSALITKTPGFVSNKWAHYALVRKSGTVYWFVNGILCATALGTSNMTVNQFAINARYGSGSFPGKAAYYDEFRISNIARWTSNFTPPNGIFVNIPTNLIAIASDSKVSISWSEVSGVTGYNVKRSTTAGGPYTTIVTNVNETSYIDNTVTNGVIYYYVVTAIDGSSNESANSNEASAIPQILVVPTNLTTTVGDTQITLSWDVVSRAIGYNVKRSTTAGGPYTTIATNITDASYIDNTVIDGNTYYYVVTAVDSSGSESTNSNEVSATPIVSAPINLIAIAGDSQVAISWNAVNGAKGYNVKRSTTAGGPYTTIANNNVTGTSYIDTTVTNVIIYYYVVTAIDSNGHESMNSNEASATPQVSSGHGLLRITMSDSSEREYQLSHDEINKFIEWCDRAVGTSNSLYVFDKTYNMGEFKTRKEYLLFDKIISLEVMEITK